MTRKRYDEHSTEFGLWLRTQKEIDSKLGYTTTNLDFIWRNYHTNAFMLIEEKRYHGQVSFSQQQTFELIDSLLMKSMAYKGFYILQFEKTNPEDGKIYLKKLKENIFIEITKKELIEFLQFKISLNKIKNQLKE